MFVTDNGFYEKNGEYFYSTPNFTHVSYLKKYFEEFIFIARNDTYDKSSLKIDDDLKSTTYLFQKYAIPKMIEMLKEAIATSDAVICYGFNGYFAYRIAKKMNKVVIAYNGGDVYDFIISRGTITGKLLAPLARYIEKDKFYNADFAHYCDYFLVDKYPTTGKVLVASGVDIVVDEGNLKRRIIKINRIKQEKYIIGLIGHTRNNLKGIETAIRALGVLGDNFELQIVGRGDHSKYDLLSEKLGIQHKIKFIGTLKAGQEIFDWLDDIDVYIQPSFIEGLPRATIEAMSRGCPVVSSNVGGLSHLIDKEYQIEYGDYKKLAALLAKLCDNPDLMILQANSNFNRSKEYSPENRDKKYETFYGEIIQCLNKNNTNE